ncbi:hypothetical protein DPMN_012388, partial [Dreissena polymorpha]
ISWTTLLIRKHRSCRRKLLPDSQQLSLTACPGPAWTILKLTMMPETRNVSEQRVGTEDVEDTD